ncbi:MAG: hypothetical protein F9K47_06150 [Burkholderiales bacterium]|nr:MAG: hypothetical protein F9K47_06150 [Burkholderiales bacterium]
MNTKVSEESSGSLVALCKRHSRLLARNLAITLIGLSSAFCAYGLQIGAGSDHAFLVRDDGSLWVWGYNFYGQYGDGTTVSRASPSKVLTNVRAAAAGAQHTLAVKIDGTLWAWGTNSKGQLGTGNTETRTLPVQVTNNVTAVAAGQFHSFALKADGTLWAWGSNSDGQLGDGTTTDRSAPVQVMTGVRSVAAGHYHSLAIRNDGTLWTWGANSGGQLGNNTTTSSSSPIQVGTAFAAIAAGKYHSLGVRIDNTLWAWGWNTSSQLGDGTTTERLSPKQVLTGVTRVAAGGYFSLALKTDGSAWAWGFNGYGQLGDSTPTTRSLPVQVNTSVTAIAAGFSFSLLAKANGELWTAGYNGSGQLGDGSTLNRAAPVYPMTSVRLLSAGAWHTMAIRTDGSLWAWGSNINGQLGDGTSTAQSSPKQIWSSGASVASAGFYHSMAIKTDGTLWAWGSNSSGQLGDGTSTSTLTPKQVLTGVKGVATGVDHSIALKNDGTVWAWGDNAYGQLGDASTTDRLLPVYVLSGAKEVAAGAFHSLALKTDGSLWAWGYNGSGQLGNGTKISASTPLQVLTNVKAISTRYSFSLALKNDGTLWAWGDNARGTIGNGSTTNQLTPVQILSDVQLFAAGTGSAMAKKTDGTLWTWGGNSAQNLGPGASTIELSPRLNIYLRNPKLLSMGNWQAAAIAWDDRVANWGNNFAGLLGVSTQLESWVFTRVLDPLAPYSNTVLVTEHFNPEIRNGYGTLGVGHYFITAGEAERAAIEAGMAGPGWSQTGRSFRAWGSAGAAPAGAVGVCRFYAREPNSHFYTASPTECQALKNLNPTNDPAKGWAYEGIAFYTILPGDAGCLGSYYPVYRSYNNRFGPPATNDGNHRITPSFNDFYRGIKYFGYVNEGIAFCAPDSPDPGGDLQATFGYPGESVQSGTSVEAEFVFSNNGPGGAWGSQMFAILPPEIPAWTVACTAREGVTCPASLTAIELRQGVTIDHWPPGGGFTITGRGTAPSASSGSEVTLHFGATAVPASRRADPTTTNNTPTSVKTVVKAAGVCSYTVTPNSLSLGSAAQNPQVTVSTSSGCAWSAQSDAQWLKIAAGSGASGSSASGTGSGKITITVNENSSSTERTGSITIQGNRVIINQSGMVAAAPTCTNPRFQRSGDQVGGRWTGTLIRVDIIAEADCQWSAVSKDSWITVATGGSGKGSGTLGYIVDTNPTSGVRTGHIQIGQELFTVSQTAASDGPGGDGGGDGGGE